MENKIKCRGLKINAQKKSNDSIKRAEDVIIKLIENKQSINFSIVSKESGLSRSFLYNNFKIRQLIENHRETNNLDKSKTDKSKDVIIAAKDAKIKKLELEIENLTTKIKKYQCILYEKI